jgi:hypothetical protein
VTQPFSATTSAGAHRIAIPHMNGTDIQLVDFISTFYISGGTALSGSHKWVVSATKNPSGTSLGTIANIASGSSSAWRETTVTLNALLGTTDFQIDLVHTKTGTPGSLYITTTVTYRIVAT